MKKIREWFVDMSLWSGMEWFDFICIVLMVLCVIAMIVVAILAAIGVIPWSGNVESTDTTLHLLPNGKGGFNVFAW